MSDPATTTATPFQNDASRLAPIQTVANRQEKTGVTRGNITILAIASSFTPVLSCLSATA